MLRLNYKFILLLFLCINYSQCLDPPKSSKDLRSSQIRPPPPEDLEDDTSEEAEDSGSGISESKDTISDSLNKDDDLNTCFSKCTQDHNGIVSIHNLSVELKFLEGNKKCKPRIHLYWQLHPNAISENKRVRRFDIEFTDSEPRSNDCIRLPIGMKQKQSYNDSTVFAFTYHVPIGMDPTLIEAHIQSFPCWNNKPVKFPRITTAEYEDKLSKCQQNTGSQPKVTERHTSKKPSHKTSTTKHAAEKKMQSDAKSDFITKSSISDASLEESQSHYQYMKTGDIILIASLVSAVVALIVVIAAYFLHKKIIIGASNRGYGSLHRAISNGSSCRLVLDPNDSSCAECGKLGHRFVSPSGQISGSMVAL